MRSVIVFAIGACALGACAEGPAAEAPRRALSAYQGRATELLDDAIEPRAVGLTIDAVRSPKGDPILRARTEASDAVVRVRITTVTSKRDATEPTYELGFHVVDRIAGAHAPPSEFSIELAPRAPAVGIVRRFEDRLVPMNLTFLAFVGDFAPDGEWGASQARMHFHLSPDDADIIAAVIDAAAIAELR